MEYYAILMFVFAGCLFFYAALLMITKDPKLILRGYAAKMKDKRQYAAQVGRVLGLTALAPFLSALIARGTDNGIFSVLALIVGLVFFIWLGVRGMKNGEG